MLKYNVQKFLNENLPELDKDKKVLTVLSGGLDSSTLTSLCVEKYGKDKVISITFHYGQRLSYEIECAKKLTKKLGIGHKIIDISFFGPMVKEVCALAEDGCEVPNIEDTLGDPQCPTYVPFRNLIFLSIACGVAEANNVQYILYGAQSQDVYQYWDTTPEFIKRVNDVISLNRRHQIVIEGPFKNITKAEEISMGKQIGVDYSITWTCYRGPDEKGRACGRCPGCSDRVQHFIKAGYKDDLEYAVDIPWEKLIEEYHKK